MFSFKPNDFFWEFLVSLEKLPEFFPESIPLQASASQVVPKSPAFSHIVESPSRLIKAVALERIRLNPSVPAFVHN